MSETSQDPKLPQQAAPEPGDVPSEDTPVDDAAGALEHAGVAERISAVLQSAEVAAEAIRQEALAKAEEALKEAQVHLARAKEDAARIRNDAEAAAKDAQGAAEYGATQRREVEQRVQQVLAEAEAQARATRQAAEEKARLIEQAARQREKQLQAQMRPLETSLQRALDAFRGITAQLEDLLGSGSLRESEDLVELERGYYVSFSEALGEPVRTDHWEEAARPQEQRND